MNKNQITKEKSCVFYVSDYHFEMISLPYISKKLEEKKKIIVLTEDNLENTVKTLTLKINLKEDKKQSLLNLDWKNNDENKFNKLKEYINEEDNIEIFIKGSNEYIEKTNTKIREYTEEYNEIKIIDCYDVGRVDEYLVDIAQKYNNVIGTAGEKSL